MNPNRRPESLLPERKRTRRCFMVAALCLYVLAYAVLSRNGFAKSDAMGISGMWFFTPDDGEHWRTPHYTCVILFAPLIAIDNLLGTGRPIGPEPLWSLSSTGGQQEADVNVLLAPDQCADWKRSKRSERITAPVHHKSAPWSQITG